MTLNLELDSLVPSYDLQHQKLYLGRSVRLDWYKLNMGQLRSARFVWKYFEFYRQLLPNVLQNIVVNIVQVL